MAQSIRLAPSDMRRAQIPLDPREISKVEISAEIEPFSLVRVFLVTKRDPVEFKFENRKTAIEFVNDFWQLRKTRYK